MFERSAAMATILTLTGRSHAHSLGALRDLICPVDQIALALCTELSDPRKGWSVLSTNLAYAGSAISSQP